MVKADSKGRVTGATPGAEYHYSSDRYGRIVLTPKTPQQADEERTVSRDEFENFFGAPIEHVRADGMHVVYQAEDPDCYAAALVLETFVLTPDGKRVMEGEGNLTNHHIIKIRKE